MQIAGFIKTSFVDYPGKIASVVFVRGCNLNCVYCHNRHIIGNRHETGGIACEEVFAYLTKRRGMIDAVVISGGEPTIQRDFLPFLKQVKDLGYSIKLDTNGTNPDVLAEVLKKELVDYISMDLKAPLNKYNVICACEMDCTKIRQSMELLRKCGVRHEYRTTLCRLLTADDVLDIAGMVAVDNEGRYIVQRCRGTDEFPEDLCIGEEQWRMFYLPKLEGHVSEYFETRGFLLAFAKN